MEENYKYYLRTLEDPILREPCVEVNDFSDLDDLLPSMYWIMVFNFGVGLAAPQVGDNRRIAIATIDGQTREFINPRKLKEEEYTTIPEGEGCLSVPPPDAQMQSPKVRILRRYSIEVEYQDRKGTYHNETFIGSPAIVLQHEMDHLDGRLTIDYIKPKS